VGLGCNNFGRASTRTASLAGTIEVVDAAIDAGVTFFDTADRCRRARSDCGRGPSGRMCAVH
jgi:aryl-alcohol dehydrogenase-like predicted oxidoreductase